MRNVAKILYDGYGQPLAILEDQTIFGDQPGLIFAGKDDNGLARFFRVTDSGAIKTVSGERTVLGEYYFGSDLILGSGSIQDLITLENPIGSGLNLYINKITINGTVDSRFTTAFLYRISRTTGLPSGGTTQTPQLRNSNDTSPTGIIRTSAIVTSATGNLWTGSPGIMTKDGSHNVRLEAIAAFEEKKEIVLIPGEGVVISADPNSSSWRHWINLHWNEVLI